MEIGEQAVTTRRPLSDRGYSVNLYFDSRTQDNLSALWADLEKEGVPSLKQMFGASSHITLTVFEIQEFAGLRDRIRSLAAETPAVPLNISAIGCFQAPQGAVFLVPMMTEQLLALHRETQRILTELGIRGDAYYWPENWLPHCTVCRQLSEEDLMRAIGVCRRANVFHRTLLTEIGLVEYQPIHEHFRFALGDKKAV